MGFSEYVGRGEWLIAIAAFALIGVFGVALLRGLEVVLFEIGNAIHDLNSTIADALLGLRHVPPDPWACSVCRSVNLASADVCYRDCGIRADVAIPGAVVASGPIDPL